MTAGELKLVQSQACYETSAGLYPESLGRFLVDPPLPPYPHLQQPTTHMQKSAFKALYGNHITHCSGST